MTSERTSKGQLLTIVIGANGAGKTTWVRKHRALLPERFYNADSIAEGLGDANSAERQSEARQIVDRAIQQDMNHERAFGFESTYSGRSRPEIVKQARRAGYTVNALFIGTERHEINAARVAKRAEEGGHDIAYQEVVRRWAAVQENLIGTWSEFGRITILDNSGDETMLVAEYNRNKGHIKRNSPQWVRDLVERATRGERGTVRT